MYDVNSITNSLSPSILFNYVANFNDIIHQLMSKFSTISHLSISFTISKSIEVTYKTIVSNIFLSFFFLIKAADCSLLQQDALLLSLNLVA